MNTNYNTNSSDTFFVIVIAVYNAEKYIKKCLTSVLNQKYSKYKVVITDDCSTDGTYDIIREYKDNKLLTIYRNEKRIGSALHNIITMTNKDVTEDEDVIVSVDGDDWLAHDNVLQKLNSVYQNKDIWFTYGQMMPVSKKYPPICGYVNSPETYRQSEDWKVSHLRTYKKKVWRLIDDEDFRDINGKYYDVAWDGAIIYPIMEMCGTRHYRFIKEILYIYNDQNELNDTKIKSEQQLKCWREIQKKHPYNRLDDNLKVVNPFFPQYKISNRYKKVDLSRNRIDRDEFFYLQEKYRDVAFNYSVGGKVYSPQAGYRHLLVMEPFIELPIQWNMNIIKQYDTYITYNREFYEESKRYVKQSFLIKGSPFCNFYYELDNFRNYDEKIKGVVMMNKLGQTNRDGDIYSLREKVMTGLKLPQPYVKHIYSKQPWGGNLYQGKLDFYHSHYENLKKINEYLFCICFESTYHPKWSLDFMTERLFNCFKAKTVPIYLGCYNIEDYVPTDLFIDYRNFVNEQELSEYLINFSKERYADMTERAYQWQKNNNIGSILELEKILNKISCKISRVASPPKKILEPRTIKPAIVTGRQNRMQKAESNRLLRKERSRRLRRRIR